HLAVQARIELARVHLALADAPGARTLTDEIDEILRHRPELGVLVDETLELEARIPVPRVPDAREASSLTAAELRLLPLLATHLSFPEIGAEMFLSPNTVKSQAMSIYRKLGASSRNQAVIRSRELGLLEGAVPRQAQPTEMAKLRVRSVISCRSHDARANPVALGSYG